MSKILTKAALTAQMGISPRLLDKYVSEGLIKKIQPHGKGSKTFFDESEVIEGLKFHRDARYWGTNI